ncbi:SURF1 family protein [Variovorax sp. RHLX14]|uniref:SURF1 family protein n=1 Tax=Variovorax sp. RHLX14 TaxID=1259731 RepID=UPI003F48DD09
MAARIARLLFLLLALGAFIGFVALGTWQVERRTWKLALIERVTQRVIGAPAVLPGRDRWSRIDAAEDEYRRVRLNGVFLNDRETLVQASTDYGSGFWVMTPMQLSDGSIVLVNRGFVSPEKRVRSSRNDGSSEPRTPRDVVGLLRLTQPGGSFLRHNDPAAERWYSRDVQAIAQARGLAEVAPYFVDAQANAQSGARYTAGGGGNAGEIIPGTIPSRWPVAGLTVIDFHNNHLAYAITWYALALMIALAVGYVLREERRDRRSRAAAGQPGHADID